MVIFSAPSGAGKTTIVRHLRSIEKFRFELSISACTRQPREGEVHGKDYYFISVDEFRERVANGEFLEWEEVYEGRLYGTLKSEVERIWANGNNVAFDVDVVGGVNIKQMYGEKALSIFVRPPDIQTLEKRLRGRDSDSEEDLKVRLEKAKDEMLYADRFDVVLVNDVLEDTLQEAEQLVTDFLEK